MDTNIYWVICALFTGFVLAVLLGLILLGLAAFFAVNAIRRAAAQARRRRRRRNRRRSR